MTPSNSSLAGCSRRNFELPAVTEDDSSSSSFNACGKRQRSPVSSSLSASFVTKELVQIERYVCVCYYYEEYKLVKLETGRRNDERVRRPGQPSREREDGALSEACTHINLIMPRDRMRVEERREF